MLRTHANFGIGTLAFQMVAAVHKSKHECLAKAVRSTWTAIERNKREGVLTRSPHIRNLSLACLIALALSAATAVAQSWPTRFVTLVVPFGPGSGSDTVAHP